MPRGLPVRRGLAFTRIIAPARRPRPPGRAHTLSRGQRSLAIRSTAAPPASRRLARGSPGRACRRLRRLRSRTTLRNRAAPRANLCARTAAPRPCSCVDSGRRAGRGPRDRPRRRSRDGRARGSSGKLPQRRERDAMRSIESAPSRARRAPGSAPRQGDTASAAPPATVG